MKTILASILVCLCCILGASGWSSESVVSVNVIPPSEPAEFGKLVRFAVELNISKPYHINSNQPLEDYLIPTTIEFEPRQDVTFGKIAFPVAEIKKLPVSDAPMAVYEGVVKIPIELTPDANLKAKKIVVHGSVRYQACDDHVCLPPVRQSFSLELTSGSSAHSQTNSQKAVSPSGMSGEEQGGAPSSADEIAKRSSSYQAFSDFGDKSLPATLVLVFLGGLVLNRLLAYIQ